MWPVSLITLGRLRSTAIQISCILVYARLIKQVMMGPTKSLLRKNRQEREKDAYINSINKQDLITLS